MILAKKWDDCLKSIGFFSDLRRVEKPWYVYANRTVSGPLATAEVKAKLSSGEFQDAHIWWQGQKEWIEIDIWRTNHSQYLFQMQRKDVGIWYLDSGRGQAAIGPLTRSELVATLSKQLQLAGLRVWSTGMSRWVPIFEMEELIDELGISRRASPRAPLMGQILIKRVESTEPLMSLALTSISAGGLGFKDAVNLQVNDICQIEIKSPDLIIPESLQGEVVYLSLSGFGGMAFRHTKPKVTQLISSYVELFKLPDDIVLSILPASSKTAA